MDDAVWVPTVFTKNRERLLEHDAVVEPFSQVLQSAHQHGWLSSERFSVDAALIQAWARHRRSAVPDAIAKSKGYAASQQKRKLIEEGFGGAKTVGAIRQVMVRALEQVDQMLVPRMVAYNLTRMRTVKTKQTNPSQLLRLRSQYFSGL